MRMVKAITIASVLFLTIGTSAALVQDGEPVERASRAVGAYAKSFKVSPEEAARRLAAQRGVGDLNEKLEASESDTFGGLYIEHTPVHRVVVKFTSGGDETLRRYTQNPMFVAVSAPVTYKQLVDAQAIVYAALKVFGIDSASRVDVVTSRLEFYVAEPAAVQRLRASGAVNLPEFVDLKKALDLSPSREQSTRVEGGRALSGGNCTSGFTVYSTASSGTTQRSITSVRTYAQMATGDWVCKYGSATGYTCGQIVSKSYNLQGAPGFVRVHDPDNYNMSAGGDSGGPYYDDYTYPNSAWGSHSDSARGVNPNDSVFMPISYISASKPAVLTVQ